MESTTAAAASHPLRLLPLLAGNLRPKTSLWKELGGAVGDLGTYIPIALALSLVNGLDLGTTLIFTALYNAVTGVLFGIPMPVQPMKSIAAAAISPSSRLSLPQIMAAGLLTASSLLLLGASGLMSLLYRLLPLPVIRGIQLSQGLSFAFTAVSYIRFNQDLHSGKASGSRPFLGLDGLLLALSALLFILLSSGSGDEHGNNAERECEGSTPRRRIFVPTALLVFLLGLILCFARDPSVIMHLNLGPSPIRLVRITREDWKIWFLRGAVPQIPLSILNSVIVVCKLSGDLFPEREVSAVAVAVSLSVGVMNWAGCWFGRCRSATAPGG